MKTIFAAAALLALAAGCTQQHTIEVTNASNANADGEMAEVPLADILAAIGEEFVITDPKGAEVPYQITYDSLVVFPADVPAETTVAYRLAKGTPQKVDTIVYGRQFPERKDDMAWENDRSAYRAYGPALQESGERAFGYDIWTKSVATPILEQRFADDIERGISFHVDHGNGMDVYGVGPTLGGGTAALLDSLGSIVFPYCYADYEILDHGPLRFTVRLDYRPMAVDGDSAVVEHRLITLDRGSWLNRTTVSYDGLSTPRQLAPGIVVHDSNPDGYDLMEAEHAMAYADLTEDPANGNGTIYIGVVAPQSVAMRYQALAEPAGAAIGHILAPSTYTPGESYTYWWGSGWSKSGVTDMDAWKNILATRSALAATPLKAAVK